MKNKTNIGFIFSRKKSSLRCPRTGMQGCIDFLSPEPQKNTIIIHLINNLMNEMIYKVHLEENQLRDF